MWESFFVAVIYLGKWRMKLLALMDIEYPQGDDDRVTSYFKTCESFAKR
ncbi:hypothetical protein ACT7DH_13605 [Bacillus pacificus]